MNVSTKKMKTSIALLLAFLFVFLNSLAQVETNEFSLLFYNAENLFDTWNDSLKNDDDFTPEGNRHWTNKRLNKKLQNISKVILNASGWNPPALVALCEVENRYVLERLRKDTPLNSIPYKIIHKESPDHRGIDVAILYNPDEFYPLGYRYYPLQDQDGEILATRETLHLNGLVNERDTLHVFVNHWPSRYSGVMETRELRNSSAQQLRVRVDELLQENSEAKIIIVGDFNDQPSDESMSRYLNAQSFVSDLRNSILYNLSYVWGNKGKGTLKYQSRWFVFDQIIVSGALLNPSSTTNTKPEWAQVVRFPYLLEQDKVHGGEKPFRTYTGYTYNGGFSDHFPVLLKLKVR